MNFRRLTPRRYGELLNKFGGLKHETKGRMMPDFENEDFKATVSELANAIQTVALLSTQIRRESVDLESAAERAVQAVKQLQKSA